MDGQEAFRRLARQIRTVGGGGPGGPGKGIFAGSGLLIALVAGGFALNASLFNGMSPVIGRTPKFPDYSKLTVVTAQLSIVGEFSRFRDYACLSFGSIHGVKEEIYNEGTHLVVCLLIIQTASIMTPASSCLGWRRPLSLIFVLSHGVLPVLLEQKAGRISLLSLMSFVHLLQIFKWLISLAVFSLGLPRITYRRFTVSSVKTMTNESFRPSSMKS